MNLNAPRITITGLEKTFGNETVLKGINLTVQAGEFVGLMGPNGAGKSTLLKILDGVYAATRGEIVIGDKKVASLKGRPDVAFIHQDLGLIDTMTITENLRLGQKKLRLAGPVLSTRKEKAAAERALERIGLDRAVDTLLYHLSPGEKTLVAIARALDKGASVLFVDEATSTLPPSEAAKVITALRISASQGASIVMVTHKLHEILEAGSRIVVLLDGEMSADQPRAEVNRESLVQMLAAHERPGAEPNSAERAVPTRLITFENARTEDAGPVNLELNGGEIIGLTGLPGSGLHEVAFLIARLEKLRAGTVRSDAEIRTGFIPPFRETQAGLNGMTLRENVTISSLGKLRTLTGLLSLSRERKDVERVVNDLNVMPRNIEGSYDALSGGNKQKALFARVLLKNPNLYVLCEPTRGVDVGTRAEVYDLIFRVRDAGAAVLIVSSDAEDLFVLCDRIGIVSGGTVGTLRETTELTAKELEVMV